ncbi:hypothetical protein ABZ297_35355 [Nonomuraea sp. NPDC005983]|uniref:hypothetical protein n=1 Tax=Nonomuraea sp. NPDC005983 TaxID=3155595 RepID=UPI0033A61631
MTTLTRAGFVSLLAAAYCVVLLALALAAVLDRTGDGIFEELLTILAFPAGLVTKALSIDVRSFGEALVALTLCGLLQAGPLWWYGRGRPRTPGSHAWASDETIAELMDRYPRGRMAFWLTTGYGLFALGAIAAGVVDMAGDMTDSLSPVFVYALLPLSVPALILANYFLYVYAFVIAAIVQTKLLWFLLRGRGAPVDLPAHLRPWNRPSTGGRERPPQV